MVVIITGCAHEYYKVVNLPDLESRGPSYILGQRIAISQGGAKAANL